MAEIIMWMYKCGYWVWNSIVGTAMTLFTTSPMSAGGGVYDTAHSMFLAVSDISIPIAIVFFLIAIIKDVTSTPPDQQARRFFSDALKFGVMVGILVNLWTIMGCIIQIADGITGNLSASASYSFAMPSELEATINSAMEFPDMSATEIWENIKKVLSWVVVILILLLSSLGTLVTIVASSVSILSSAFQRILKPLVLLPFSCITVALAAGTAESARVTNSYMKAFFGFCISGGFMAVCVNLGAALANGLVDIDYGSMSDIGKALIISIQAAIAPIFISGLVKNADGIIGKFF